jgi:hypothetical protein
MLVFASGLVARGGRKERSVHAFCYLLRSVSVCGFGIGSEEFDFARRCIDLFGSFSTDLSSWSIFPSRFCLFLTLSVFFLKIKKLESNYLVLLDLVFSRGSSDVDCSSVFFNFSSNFFFLNFPPVKCQTWVMRLLISYRDCK